MGPNDGIAPETDGSSTAVAATAPCAAAASRTAVMVVLARRPDAALLAVGVEFCTRAVVIGAANHDPHADLGEAVATALCGPVWLPSNRDRTESCGDYAPQAFAALRSVAATSSDPSRTALPNLNKISLSAPAACSHLACSMR